MLEFIKDGRVVLFLLSFQFINVLFLFRVVRFHFRLFFILVVEVYLVNAESAFILEFIHVLAEDMFRPC